MFLPEEHPGPTWTTEQPPLPLFRSVRNLLNWKTNMSILLLECVLVRSLSQWTSVLSW